MDEQRAVGFCVMGVGGQVEQVKMADFSVRGSVENKMVGEFVALFDDPEKKLNKVVDMNVGNG